MNLSYMSKEDVMKLIDLALSQGKNQTAYNIANDALTSAEKQVLRLQDKIRMLEADIKLRNHYGACERCAVGPCSEGRKLKDNLSEIRRKYEESNP